MYKRLLVAIPAYNEETTIESVIHRIPHSIKGFNTIDILVIDDGSKDHTAELSMKCNAKVIRHTRNHGVGKAITTAFKEAIAKGYDVLVHIDADGQFNPEDISVLLEPIVNEDADFVTASRFKNPDLTPQMPFLKKKGNYFMSWLISFLLNEKFYDVSCGFRAYTRETLLHMHISGTFTYTHETFMVLSYLGFRIKEIPLSIRGEREFGQSRIASNLLKYAFRTMTIILSCLRDYKPGLFFGIIFFLFFFPALFLMIFFFSHYVIVGSFSPHLWAGFLSFSLMVVCGFILLFSQIAGMQNRIRFMQEEQLYIIRKLLHDHFSKNNFESQTNENMVRE